MGENFRGSLTWRSGMTARDSTVDSSGVGDDSGIGDEIVSAVASEKRRLVLRRLSQAGTDTPMPVDTLVDTLDEHLDGESDEAMERRHLGIALHHVHLPHLESVGLVERPDESRVRLADQQVVEAVLELIESFD